MTPVEQIIVNVVIAIVVGVLLIGVGVVLQPFFKRLWERMNWPTPLTPQTKGQLVTNLAIWEGELERLNYLSTHTKDLFLRLIQLVMVVLLFAILSFWLYALNMLMHEAPYLDFALLLILVLLAVAGVFCGLGVQETNRLSDKRIDATKESIQKRIDEINRLLNPPVA